jgi:hypothetical protein
MKFEQWITAGSLVLAANAVSAQPALDASKPMICAATHVVECVHGGACTSATPDMYNLPVLLRIDLSEKVIEQAREGGSKRKSAIANAAEVEGVHLLSGTDGTAGWSMTIDHASGQMTVASARTGLSHTIFGSCASL